MAETKKKNKKNPKYDFCRRYRDCGVEVKAFVNQVAQNLKNKYYNVWMSKFKWSGLDEEIKEQQENYIMRKLWSLGTVALRNIKHTGLLAMCPWSVEDYNYLDFPETVILTNTRGVARSIIPSSVQVVNKDVALLYCLPSHKPIESVVNYYVDRMIQVEVVISNNLKLQNIPFVIGVTEEDKDQFDDIIERILNNELVVFTSVNDIKRLQTLTTNAPYIVDKLKTYLVSLENELLTVLGIDNSGAQAKQAQLTVDEVNASNDIINDYGLAIEDELKAWLNRANKVLGRNISIEAKIKPVDSTHDYEDVTITESKEKSEEEE